MNLTIPQICKSVQRFWKYEVIKNITYIQDTREKHNPSLAVGKKKINKSNSLSGLTVGTSLNYAGFLVKILLIKELLIGPDS